MIEPDDEPALDDLLELEAQAFDDWFNGEGTWADVEELRRQISDKRDEETPH